MKQKILLTFAIGFGLLAFFLTYYQLNQEKQKFRSRTEQYPLIKATRSILDGEELQEGINIKVEPVERLRGQLDPDEIVGSKISDIQGYKATRNLSAGEIVRYTDLKFTTSASSGLAGIFEKDFRAISIPVDTTASVSNMVKPGDRVDIIGTFRFPELKGDKNLETQTVTLLQNVVILATGSQYTRTVKNDASRSYNTVTLALTPSEVEIMVFAA